MTKKRDKHKKQSEMTAWPGLYQPPVETEKLFVYGIFLDEFNRDRYGMTNPHYTTIPGYITVGHGIVQAVKVSSPDIALTGLMVDMDSSRWGALDSLEAGYTRVKVQDDTGVEAWMYAEPESWRE